MKKKNVIYIALLVVELAIIIKYFLNFKGDLAFIWDVIFAMQIILFTACSLVLLLKSFSLKRVLVNIVITALLMILVSSNFGILYYKYDNSMEMFDFIRQANSAQVYASWEYYNFYDKGLNTDIKATENYEVQNGFVADEVLKEFNGKDRNFAINGLHLVTSDTMAYNNYGKVIESSSLGYLEEWPEDYIDLSTEGFVSAYNDGEYIYSLNNVEDDYSVYKYTQEGEVLNNQIVSLNCPKYSSWGISYIDELKNIYVSCKNSDGDLEIKKINQDYNVSDFIYIENSKVSYRNFQLLRLMKMSEIDDGFEITLGGFDNYNYFDYAFYHFTFDKNGEVIEESIYQPQKTFYDVYPVNIVSGDDTTYVISYVIADNFKDPVTFDGDTNSNVIRIDELDKDFQVQQYMFLESDNLGNYAVYFDVEKDGDQYIIYSNNGNITFGVTPKERILIFNNIVGQYILVFSIIFGLQVWLKALREELLARERNQ